MFCHYASRPFFAVYEGESTDSSADKEKEAEPDSLSESETEKKFSQSDVNRFMQENKQALQKENQTLLDQMRRLEAGSNLSKKERIELQDRIKELEQKVLTKEELAERERQKLERERKTAIDEISKDRDSWKDRYTAQTIRNTIYDGAAREKAVSQSQIYAILRSMTSLEEEIDADGNRSGNLAPMVDYEDTDKEGKPVRLKLTVAQAIKRMKETPDLFGNLFESDKVAGMGGSASQGRKGGSNMPPKDPKEYMEWRKTHAL